MYTNTQTGRQFVADLAKTIIEKEAPEELPFFDELMKDYFASPSPPTAQTASDDALGSGLENVLLAMAPAVAGMITAVLGNVLGDQTLRNGLADSIKQSLKKLLRQNLQETEKEFAQAEQHLGTITDKASEELQFAKMDLREIEEQAIEAGIQFGLGKKKAHNLARVIIGSLVLAER